MPLGVEVEICRFSRRVAASRILYRTTLYNVSFGIELYPSLMVESLLLTFAKVLLCLCRLPNSECALSRLICRSHTVWDGVFLVFFTPRERSALLNMFGACICLAAKEVAAHGIEHRTEVQTAAMNNNAS